MEKQPHHIVFNYAILLFLLVLPAQSQGTLFVEGDYVGIGTSSPSSILHVFQSGSGAEDMIHLENNGPSRFLLENTNVSSEWRFNADNGKNLRIAENTTAVDVEFVLSDTGNLTITGSLTENSSADAKEHFQAIDRQRVLARVLELPIITWSYRRDPATVRHMGPMAQDFFAAFSLGHSPDGIAPRNLSAVALAAIQGLKKEKDSEIESLRSENAALRTEIDALRSLVEKISNQR